jgi:hypothetical protein
VAHESQLAPAKPALQAHVQDAGAPLTELALPLHDVAVLHCTQVG